MARSVRIQYAGAVYHVLCRGDRREPIFTDDGDRRVMLETLGEVCARTGFIVHSYVLMPNHYHFLLETPEPNLVAGMKWFQGTYTQRYNCRNGLCGHLFQGRYKAVPIESDHDSYFRRVSDYIHLNPVRAGLLRGHVNPLESFVWSSYPTFVGKAPLPEWLHRGRVFSHHGLSHEDRGSRRRYATILRRKIRAIMGEDGSEVDQAERDTMRQGWFLGSQEFRDQLLERAAESTQGNQRSSYERQGMVRHDEQAGQHLLEQAMVCLGVSLADLHARRQTDPIKQAVAWWVKSHSVVGDEWICRRLEMGARTNVHRAVKAFRHAEDPERAGAKEKLQLCAD